MATLKTNTQNPENFDLTELTADDLDMIQVALIELQSTKLKDDEFKDDRKKLFRLFHDINAFLIAEA